MAVKQFPTSLLCIRVALWFLLVWLNQSANMKMQPSPGHSTRSRSSEGLLFPTKSSKLPFLVCGVFYNTVLNLPHLLSMAPQNVAPASVLVSPVSWKHTFSVSYSQPLFASDPLSSFLQELESESEVAQLCLTLCDPMNRSTPGLPVHHQLPEFTQTHVHWVGDAIQPSHPLSSPTPPAPNPSQHPSLFQWVNSSHEVAKVLEFQL